MMELWDLYNKRRELTKQTMVRGEPIPKNYYHLVVHVWIHDGNGKYLISQRSKNRQKNPLLWECVGGSVLAGEDSITAALRETEEEVGVKLFPTDGKLLFSKLRDVIDGVPFCDIVDVWLFKYNGAVELKNATTDEVEKVRWMTLDEIKELWDNGLFVPTLGYFFTDINPQVAESTPVLTQEK